MGQYYKIYNLTKQVSISPRDVGNNGIKLMEHSYIDNDCIGAVVTLLSNEWKGDRIAWIGDYHETGEMGGIPSREDLDENCKELKPTPVKVNTGFLNNHTKKISIDLSKVRVVEGGERGDVWYLHPLSLMTACGNGKGNGDYSPDDEIKEAVGNWAGDEFSYSPDNAEFQVRLGPFYKEDPNSVKFAVNK